LVIPGGEVKSARTARTEYIELRPFFGNYVLQLKDLALIVS